METLYTDASENTVSSKLRIDEQDQVDGELTGGFVPLLFEWFEMWITHVVVNNSNSEIYRA